MDKKADTPGYRHVVFNHRQSFFNSKEYISYTQNVREFCDAL